MPIYAFHGAILGVFLRDAHGYPDIRINPDNKLSV